MKSRLTVDLLSKNRLLLLFSNGGSLDPVLKCTLQMIILEQDIWNFLQFFKKNSNCKITLSLTTKENIRKYRLQGRKHKFSDVENLAHFKDTEVFTLKCYKFILTRLFREMQDSFERLLPSFVGSCIDNKPAYTKRNEKIHKKYHNNYVPILIIIINLVRYLFSSNFYHFE